MAMAPSDQIQLAKKDPPSYEDRFVALVDILGWSAIVAKSVVDPSVLSPLSEGAEIISKARGWVEELNRLGAVSPLGEIELDIRVSHFSDTFVFSLPASPTSEAPLLLMLKEMCMQLLDYEHYTRGAIVRGLVRHTDNVLYGPAILEAYELERSVAKYPRILVAPSAVPLFEIPGVLRTDFDGLVHLDILRPYRPTDDDISQLEKTKAMVARKEKADLKDLGLTAKHRWLLAYVEELLRWARGQTGPAAQR